MSALADPTRRRLLALLEGRDELCVCEMVEALRLAQYRVSRHLRELRAAGLVSAWRQSRWMHYRVNPRLARADQSLVAAICELARGEPAARADLRRLHGCLRPRTGTALDIERCCARKERG